MKADRCEFRTALCPVMNAPAEALVSISVQFPISCKKVDGKSDKGEEVEMKMIVQSTYLYQLWLAIINTHVKPSVIFTCAARQCNQEVVQPNLKNQRVNAGGCGGPPSLSTGETETGVSWSKQASQTS